MVLYTLIIAYFLTYIKLSSRDEPVLKPRHTIVAGIMVSNGTSVCPSNVRTSVFSFLCDNLSKYQSIATKIANDTVIWFGIVNGKFHIFLTELPACHTSAISFPDDNLRKYQWFVTKHDVCIDSVEIWIGIANGQISPNFDRVICPSHDDGGILSFHVFIAYIDYGGPPTMNLNA